MSKVAPSILSADFSKLGEEIVRLDNNNVDYIHIDIMDGHFVPPITFGSNILKAIRPFSDKLFDCHLMVQNPSMFIKEFIEAGADIISVHEESCTHIHRVLQEIHQLGAKAGIVLNPGTSIATVQPLLGDVDQVLQMTVNPGYGGQTFIESTLRNIEQLDKLRKDNQYRYQIEVDGGINLETGKLCVDKGADILVAGTTIFSSDNPKKMIKDLQSL